MRCQKKRKKCTLVVSYYENFRCTVQIWFDETQLPILSLTVP